MYRNKDPPNTIVILVVRFLLHKSVQAEPEIMSTMYTHEVRADPAEHIEY